MLIRRPSGNTSDAIQRLSTSAFRDRPLSSRQSAPNSSAAATLLFSSVTGTPPTFMFSDMKKVRFTPAPAQGVSFGTAFGR